MEQDMVIQKVIEKFRRSRNDSSMTRVRGKGNYLSFVEAL